MEREKMIDELEQFQANFSRKELIRMSDEKIKNLYEYFIQGILHY